MAKATMKAKKADAKNGRDYNASEKHKKAEAAGMRKAKKK